jgi:adenosylhomocysteine nucleosidase
MSIQPPFIIVAVGLAFEARIARETEAARVCCGRGTEMAAALSAALGPECCGILSFGIAGGLDPELRPGAQLVASAVVVEGGRIPTDEGWSQSLLNSHPFAIHAPILSVDEAVIDPAGKERLFQRTGAVAVDMESRIAAAVAMKYSLPFAVLRAVADPANRRVPQSAVSGLRSDGRTDALAVLRGLLRRPADITGIVGVACDAWAARLALSRTPQQLGRGFGIPDFG